MKRLFLTLIMGFSFFGLFGQTDKFKTVDASEFAKFISDTTVTVLDVRTAAEHAEGYIPGTHYNIDVLEDSYTKIATETLPKDKPVALYCRSGNRSKNAARILAEKGYEVVELGTGFRGWVAAEKEVAKDSNKE
ncbi:MAG: rhodanese-like domain-containing protein [Bacteroidales bacterium]|nr:rhodanese-like domain-containing protein [Bacteroidales bacterium]